MMYEILLAALICAFGLASVYYAKNPQKRKKQRTRIPMIENLLGSQLYLWLLIKLMPDRFPDELEVNITKNDSNYSRTKTFVRSDSGLWVPAN